MKTVILDGIGSSEGRNSGIVTTVAERLEERAGTSTHYVPWRAAMAGVGGSGSWRDNSRAAVAMICDHLDTHEEDVIFIGFSGGCKPVHDFLAKYPEYRDRVAGVGLIADPWRPHDRWQHGTRSPEPRYGICGQRYTPIPEKVLWTTAIHDPISSAWPDAIMRYLADPADVAPDQIIHRAIELGKTGGFQLAWQQEVLRTNPIGWFAGIGGRLGQFAADCQAYLFGGHTTVYTDPHLTADGNTASLAVRLADSLAWMVR